MALQVIAPYIPVKNPQLPPAVYEMVLTHFLVEDHVRAICLLFQCSSFTSDQSWGPRELIELPCFTYRANANFCLLTGWLPGDHSQVAASDLQYSNCDHRGGGQTESPVVQAADGSTG